MKEKAKVHHLKVEKYMVFLLRARQNKNMTNAELAKLMLWSETANTNYAPAFV